MSFGRTLIEDLQNEGVQIPHMAMPTVNELKALQQPQFNLEGNNPPPQPPIIPQPPQPLQPPVIRMEEDVFVDEGDDIGEKRNPTFHVGDMKLDVDSTVVMGSSIIIWILIWYSTGLMKKMQTNMSYAIVFSLFIIYQLINIVTSGNKSGGVIFELNILLTVEQMISILFGTVVVFILFNSKLPIHEKTKLLVFRLSLFIVGLLSFASLWLNVITSGRAFRALRKAKQQLYNISYTLFLLIAMICYSSSTSSNEVLESLRNF